MRPPTEIMQKLFMGITSDSKLFLAKSRAFNSMCSFASVKLQEDSRFQSTFGIPNFKISGSVYHRLGPLYPNLEFPPAFL